MAIPRTRNYVCTANGLFLRRSVPKVLLVASVTYWYIPKGFALGMP